MWNRFLARITGFSMFANSSKPLAAGVLIILLVVGFCPATSVFAAFTNWNITRHTADATDENRPYVIAASQDYVTVAVKFNLIDTISTDTSYARQKAYYIQGQTLCNVDLGYLPYNVNYLNFTGSTMEVTSLNVPGWYRSEYEYSATETFNNLNSRVQSLTLNPRVFMRAGSSGGPNLVLTYSCVAYYTYQKKNASIAYPEQYLQMDTSVDITVSNVRNNLGWRSVDVVDYEPLYPEIHNINIGLDGLVNDTAAAEVVEQAKDNFENSANQLESGQANLENAADASLAAVDTSKIGLIGTYSQSVNWWMKVINWLPTGTGALWDVVVFGFLIAFLLFILRLVR